MIAGQSGLSQVARKEKPKGPRATGLIELAANGKAHLIPITIMVDGKFYDASAYKADPVPFALESEVVYQAMRTGVPQGEFTVTGALQAQNTWFGEGKWVAGGAKARKTHVAEAKPNLDDDSGPPTLRKAGSKSSKTPEPAPAPSSAPAPPTSDTSHTTDSGVEGAPAHAAKLDVEDSSATANDQDPNRPSLRRGKQPPPPSSSPTSGRSTASTSPLSPAPQTGSKPNAPAKSTGPVQLIPAVSDAGGPEPRPYLFDMKAEEEQAYRKKLLALASAEVASKAKQMTPVLPSAAPVKKTPVKSAPKPPQAAFDNVQLRAFDLSNTNEPVFVFTAQAHLPSSTTASAESGSSTYFVTLVAKADIYLDLHKLLAQVTDERHLDEFPRFELVDAVDADGDGRGELLFREVSDAGSAWAVYRAAADKLYPLFEGKPQQPHPPPVSDR